MAKDDGIYLDVLQRYLIPWSDAFARDHIHPTGDGRYLIDQEGVAEIRAAVDRVIDAMDSMAQQWQEALPYWSHCHTCKNPQ